MSVHTACSKDTNRRPIPKAPPAASPRLSMPYTTNPELVEERILEALYRRGSEATVADLVVATGVPARQVEDCLERLSREFLCYEAVTESGELLYSLPRGAEPEQGGRRAPKSPLTEVRRASRSAVRHLMKRAPLLAMAGYFVLFLTIPFPPALLFLAILLSNWTDMDLLDFDANPHQRGGERIGTPNAIVLDYLFGSTRVEVERTTGMLLSALSLLRGKKGILTLPDVMSLTGLAPREAQAFFDELLLRYSGDPTVSDGGLLVYRFPELMRTAAPAEAPADHAFPSGKINEARGSVEEVARKKSRILTVVNFTNLLFSVYYGVLSVRLLVEGRPALTAMDRLHPGISLLFNAIYTFAAGSSVPYVLPLLFCLLGAIPFGISSIFFALHRRSLRRRAYGRRAEFERRLRQEVYAQVFSHPAAVDPATIRLPSRIQRRCDADSSVTKIVDELAAVYHAEIEIGEDGHYVYHFAELEYEGLELARLRAATDLSQFSTGHIVFEAREPEVKSVRGPIFHGRRPGAALPSAAPHCPQVGRGEHMVGRQMR